MAYDTLARLAPLRRDFVVEFEKGPHRLVGLDQQRLIDLLLFCRTGRMRLQNLPFVDPSHSAVLLDPDLDGLVEVAECLGAEKEDVVTRRPELFEDVVRMWWWEDDMASSEEQDVLALAAFSEVETPGTLSVRCVLCGDGEPECSRHRTANIDGWVVVEDGFEEADRV